MRCILSSISQRIKLPSICLLCEQYHYGYLALCDPCQQSFTPIEYACIHCAIPLPKSVYLVCGQCSKKTPPVDQAIAPYRFEEPLRSFIHAFKYQEGLYLCSFLATLMKQAIPPMAKKTQCLIPVPMHPKRLKARGFNHAAELTKQLGRLLNIPYQLNHCIKTKNTPPQASLSATQRTTNLRNAFQTKPLPHQHITLIDDLLTTGSTVNEVAHAFKKQGVERVDVWCCARVTQKVGTVAV